MIVEVVIEPPESIKTRSGKNVQPESHVGFQVVQPFQLGVKRFPTVVGRGEDPGAHAAGTDGKPTGYPEIKGKFGADIDLVNRIVDTAFEVYEATPKVSGTHFCIQSSGLKVRWT